MARRGRGSAGTTSDDVNINDSLTPMLDVVFIMLIFFIVTATFIKQAGYRGSAARCADRRAKTNGCDIDCCRTDRGNLDR